MAEVEVGIKLLDELKGGAWEAAICTTYNVSFPFLEEVVLRRLRGSGCRHVVVMADSSRVSEELASPARRPSYAGEVYSLAPMQSAASFHPKVLLLVGAKKSRLYVGSHNLTYAGFTHNLEATARVEVNGKEDRVGHALLSEVFSWFERLAASQAPAIRDAVRATGTFAELRSGPAPVGEVFFLGSEREGPSLFERLRLHCPRKVKRVFLTAPFLDGDLAFLRTLRGAFSCPIVVGIDLHHAEMDVQRARSLDGVTFVDAREAFARDARLHAKALLIEDMDDAASVLVVGSANPSGVAWLAVEGAGNVEAVLARVGRTAMLDEALGLRRLADAKPLDDAAWSLIQRRQPERRPTTEGQGLLVGGALYFERRGSELVAERRLLKGDVHGVEFVSGDRATPASWKVDADALRVRIPEEAFQLVRVKHGHGESWGICHHTERLRDLAEPSARRRLREALGSLHEIGNLEEALRAAEKVIFDDESVFRPRATAVAPSAGDASHEELATGSLSIPMSADERTQARRKRIARDDLALLLDAVLRALHRDLAPTVRPEAADAERASDDDVEQPDDDEVTVEMRERLGALVRRKSKTLISRLTKIVQGAASDADADAGRAVVRCVAVLGLLFALRKAEEKPAWRQRSIQLIDRDALAGLGDKLVPLLMSNDGLVSRARADGDGDAEELEDLPALLVWWAWAAGGTGSPTAQPDAPDLAREHAAMLAGAIVCRRVLDDAARTQFADRARGTPRAGVSAVGWWDALSAATHQADAPGPGLLRSCVIGDLVAAGPKRRLGVVLAVKGTTLEIADLLDGATPKKFKAASVQPVAWDVLVARAAGIR